ncbi:MAG: YscO family type III secretion system apparatus protein [Candidatus Competibacteraceae bacterium]
MQGLRTEEHNLLAQLEQARAAAAEAAIRVKQAEACLQKAAKAKEKLLELTTRLRKTDRQRREYAEEAELEETVLVLRPS